MLEEIYVGNETGLRTATGKLARLYAEHKKLRIAVYEYKPRSLNQNNISHAWYAEIAKQLPEDNASGWKSYCKLHHGIPILRFDDEEFKEFYDGSIKKLTYEEKLTAMKYLPVTSWMNTTQFTVYLEEVRNDFINRGIVLEYPDEQG